LFTPLISFTLAIGSAQTLLLASMQKVVLHWDLHHGNVLNVGQKGG
jgi:streptomycin 6-kinase